MEESDNPPQLTADEADMLAYIGADSEQRLRMLRVEWKNSTSDRQRVFYEGRMLELTVDMDDHPDWFDLGCLCAECRSSG